MAENFNTNHVSRSFGRGFGRGRGKDTRQKHNMSSDNSHQFSSSTSVHHNKQYEDRQNDSDSGIVKIEQNFVGRIIGKRGAKIRELQEESGCHIQISKEPNNDGTVSITLDGSPNETEKAKQMIQELVNNQSDGSSHRSGRRDWGSSNDQHSHRTNQMAEVEEENWDDPPETSTKSNYDDDRPHTNNGFGRGRSEGFGNNRSDHSFGSKRTDNDFGSNRTDSSFGSKRTDTGFGSNRTDSSFGSNRADNDFGSHRTDSSFGSKRTDNGFGSKQAEGRDHGSRWGNLDNDDCSVLEIPIHSVAKVIGKGGSKIRELQDDSGANIKINRDDVDMVTQRVKIFGTTDARKKATELIEDLLDISKRPVVETNAEVKPRRTLDWSKLKTDAEESMRAYIASLPPILKSFYEEDATVTNMTTDEAEELRESNMNIKVTDMSTDKKDKNRIPNPVATFSQAFRDYPEIMSEIEKQGFEKPSPIQMQAWPVLMKGLDLIGIAQTGTGKTLAFLLPALIHIEGQPVPREERVGPTVLCLSPTRELAQQIKDEVDKYSYKGIKCVCVYGGGDRREQINLCKSGCEIVVATPGRLNDLISNGILNVKAITYLILDEADRMLDLGFEYEIKKIVLGIRPDRQTIMTSATWPPTVQKMADFYLTNPIQVFVGSLDLAAVHSVTQLVEVIDQDFKRQRLVDFLTEELQPDDKVIVFVGKKAVADDISSDFAISGIHCDCIHGGRDQYDREQAIEGLKTGYVKILIATDVASRGIDIKDVTHVFNYDFPRNIEEYVHRVGRTGRAGRTGVSLTLMCRNDWRNAPALINIMEEAQQEIPEDLYEMAQRWERKRSQRDNERESLRGMGGRRQYGGGGGGERDQGMVPGSSGRRGGRGRDRYASGLQFQDGF